MYTYITLIVYSTDYRTFLTHKLMLINEYAVNLGLIILKELSPFIVTFQIILMKNNDTNDKIFHLYSIYETNIL